MLIKVDFMRFSAVCVLYFPQGFSILSAISFYTFRKVFLYFPQKISTPYLVLSLCVQLSFFAVSFVRSFPFYN